MWRCLRSSPAGVKPASLAGGPEQAIVQSMKKLYEAADRIEAQVLKDVLGANHVAAVILGDYLSGAAGELPANIYPAVWVVENRDLPRAEELLRDFTKSRGINAENNAWHCPRCGEWVEANFEVCWNCATPRVRET